MKTRFSLWCIALAFVVGTAAFAQAQTREFGTLGTVEPDGKIMGTAVEGVSSPMELEAYNEAKRSGKFAPRTNDASFGTYDWANVTIHAGSFIPLSGGVWNLSGATAELTHSSGNFALTSSVEAPSGALIDGFTSWYTDSDAAAAITIELWRVNLGGTVTILGSFTSGATPGRARTYTALTAPETFDHWNNNYLFVVFSNNTTVAFKAVTLWFHRTVSPAPTAASFTDVPTSHVFFQYIEALKASGITGGCTATTFCPDAFLTRGQMAVFLAKALGLHYGGYF